MSADSCPIAPEIYRKVSNRVTVCANCCIGTTALLSATFGFGAGWGALSSGGRVGDRGTGMDCAAALVAIGLGMMARLAWRKKRIEAKTKWSKS